MRRGAFRDRRPAGRGGGCSRPAPAGHRAGRGSRRAGWRASPPRAGRGRTAAECRDREPRRCPEPRPPGAGSVRPRPRGRVPPPGRARRRAPPVPPPPAGRVRRGPSRPARSRSGSRASWSRSRTATRCMRRDAPRAPSSGCRAPAPRPRRGPRARRRASPAAPPRFPRRPVRSRRSRVPCGGARSGARVAGTPRSARGSVPGSRPAPSRPPAPSPPLARRRITWRASRAIERAVPERAAWTVGVRPKERRGGLARRRRVPCAGPGGSRAWRGFAPGRRRPASVRTRRWFRTAFPRPCPEGVRSG